MKGEIVKISFSQRSHCLSKTWKAFAPRTSVRVMSNVTQSLSEMVPILRHREAKCIVVIVVVVGVVVVVVVV